MVPWANPNPQPKRHLDSFYAIFAQITAAYPYTLQWAALPSLKIALSHGELDPI